MTTTKWTLEADLKDLTSEHFSRSFRIETVVPIVRPFNERRAADQPLFIDGANSLSGNPTIVTDTIDRDKVAL